MGNTHRLAILVPWTPPPVAGALRGRGRILLAAMVMPPVSGIRGRTAWGPATLALGVAYFGVQAGAALYVAFLPVFYSAFLTSNVLIGTAMMIHSAAIVTVQPYFAWLSDRVDSRLGRRIPFLLIGTPIAALSFLALPRAPSLGLLVVATILVSIGGAIFTGPGYALMPDITPPRLRSRANGILNLMGGLGALVAFFVLSSLYRRSRTLPFDVEAAILVVALLVVLLVIPERRLSRLYQAERPPSLVPSDLEASGILPAFRLILRSRDLSVVSLMLAAMAWIGAVTGAQTMFTRYGVERLKVDPSGAAVLLGLFAGAFLAFAVPAGAIGDRLGRLAALRLGGAATLVVFASMAATHDLTLVRLLLVTGGISWALIIVNAYPLLMDRVSSLHTATYTGLWNAALGLAGLLSPPLYGLTVDRWGFGAFFVPGIVLAGTGLICTSRIKAGS